MAVDVIAANLTIASGTAMTANHGTGAALQHSDGTGASGHLASFAADGSLTDGGTTGTPRTASGSGFYRISPDGTIECWGTVATSGSGSYATASITFPHAFTTLPVVNLNTDGLPGGVDPPICQMSSLSTTTASVTLMCAVPTGGGGATFGSTTVHYRAIGY